MGFTRDRWSITLLPYKLWNKEIQNTLRNPDNIMNVNMEFDQSLYIIPMSSFNRDFNDGGGGTVNIGVWSDNIDLIKFFTEHEGSFSMLLTIQNTLGQAIKSIMLEETKLQCCNMYEDQFSGIMYPEITFSFKSYVRYLHGVDN